MDELVKTINEKANLLDYVQNQGLYLEQRGSNYFTHCKHHVDNTPSLCFSPTSNAFHCFSCGRGGKMIGYLMHYENMGFDEALEKAARYANIDPTKFCNSETISFLQKYRRSKSSSAEIQNHPILSESILDKFSDEPAQEWIDEGIEPRILLQFEIRIDDYANRIIYPVRDIDGNLINIKGRTRYDNYKELKLQKYINYYKVGVLDYFQGLDKTIQQAKASGELILFESLKSVMKAYGWGYQNCAAAETHTLSDSQILLLVKLGLDVTLAWDSDVAPFSIGVRSNIDRLRRMTNVHLIVDRKGLLGGANTKNAPVDCGKEIWDTLYSQKEKYI